jgi:hypothetical protein
MSKLFLIALLFSSATLASECNIMKKQYDESQMNVSQYLQRSFETDVSIVKFGTSLELLEIKHNIESLLTDASKESREIKREIERKCPKIKFN